MIRLTNQPEGFRAAVREPPRAEGVSLKAIDEIVDSDRDSSRDTCRENLLGEGWQGVKRSFDFWILSVGYLVVGIYYMIKGFPIYINNRVIKKKRPVIVFNELPWKDHSGLNIGYHFPLLGEMLQGFISCQGSKGPNMCLFPF